MDPPYKSRDALDTSTQNLADEPTVGWWTPNCDRAEKPSHCYWHLVVKNGNFTLLLTSSGQEWQFHIATDNLVVKFGRWTFFSQWTPIQEQRCLEYQYTKLGRWTYFGCNGTPGTRAEMPCIPVHKTWQMNLLWPVNPPPKVTEQRSLHIATDI